jgi:DNA replication ATP-dependent helicase Dna2
MTTGENFFSFFFPFSNGKS